MLIYSIESKEQRLVDSTKEEIENIYVAEITENNQLSDKNVSERVPPLRRLLRSVLKWIFLRETFSPLKFT
jgi:hypothetical protein